MSKSEAPCILCVEDNPDTRLLLKHQLQKLYRVTFASNAEEALSIEDINQFDLLLLDINLGPGKSGTELLHILRDRQDIEDIPAVAVTAYAMAGDREDLLDKGFDGYVGKPFTHAELMSAIEQVLGTPTTKLDVAGPYASQDHH